MSKVVNLRTARKAQQRLAKRQAADENAARHGRTKSEKQSDDAQAHANKRHVDGHKLDPT